MADIMMRDVSPNDPTAKAKVINEILRTVAFVDDPVTLQEYISGLSRILSVPGRCPLLGQLRLFSAKRRGGGQNAQRARARESVAEIMPAEDAAVADEKAAVADETPLLKLDSNRLRPYEEMLMRYIVRCRLLST